MPNYKRLKDPKLRKIAHRAYTEIKSKINAIHHQLLTIISTEIKEYSTSMENIGLHLAMDKGTKKASERYIACIPRYFRELDQALEERNKYWSYESLENSIKDPRKSNLVLNRASFDSGETGPVVREQEYNEEGEEDLSWNSRDPFDLGMEDYFLCAEIEDDDLSCRCWANPMFPFVSVSICPSHMYFILPSKVSNMELLLTNTLLRGY